MQSRLPEVAQRLRKLEKEVEGLKAAGPEAS
jgi:hypothetical protein